MSMHWAVSVNNGQYNFIVDAPTAADACTVAGDEWRSKATARQRTRGIYAISARHAKFGEVRNQLILSARPEES